MATARCTDGTLRETDSTEVRTHWEVTINPDVDLVYYSRSAGKTLSDLFVCTGDQIFLVLNA